MNKSSFNNELSYGDEKPSIKLIIETYFSKEIRIAFKKNQRMKEHKAPFPIIIHILSGAINFGIQEKVDLMKSGDIIELAPNIPHDLWATEDSLVRLSLIKQDSSNRVKDAANA